MRMLSVLALGLLLISAPAFAGNGNGHGNGHGNNWHNPHAQSQAQDKDDSVNLVIDRNLNVHFNSRELNIMVDWFHNQPLQYTDTRGLPPGLAKQLRERGHLPPGLAAKALPPGLAERLPPPRGYDRVVIGSDVVLVQIATGVIADILRNVL